jgi:aminoglycoside phosphotransferase
MMNIVKKERSVIKSYESRERFSIESSILNFLSSAEISDVVPIVQKQEVDRDNSSCVTVMSLIKGKTLNKRSLSSDIARNLGQLLARIHAIRSYDYFGSFDDKLDVIERYKTFSNFAAAQLDIWHKRLGYYTHDFDEEVCLIRRNLTDNPVILDRVGSALFCHNDVRLQNIIIDNQKVAGVIDWEFAGAYPLMWELRKLTPIIFWETPSVGLTLAHEYQRHLPLAVFPNVEQQSITVAIDCIGALGWSYLKGDTKATKHSAILLETSLHNLCKSQIRR